MSEESIEQAIQDKNLNAPRLTPEHISDAIRVAQYYVFPGTQTTVCCITLHNGFTVIGESACVSPKNYDSEIGEKIAFDNARDKIWLLEGYLLNAKLKEKADG